MNSTSILSHPFSTRTVAAVAAIALAGGAAMVSQMSPRAVAQNAPATKQATAATGRNGDIHIANSPQGRAVSDQANGIHRLQKDVRVTQDGEDFVLYCDDLTYYEKDNSAAARVNPHVDSAESTIIGDIIRADFDAKNIVITGKVTMRSYGPKDGVKSTATGKPLRDRVLHKASSMTCDRIDYNYETRQAVVSGNIRMRQGDSFGTCDQIRFDEARNIVRLIGNVKFKQGDGQSFKTGDLTIWLDSNTIATERPVRIDFPQKPSNNKTRPRPKRDDFGDLPVIPDNIYSERGLKPGPPPALPPIEDPNDIITPPAPVEAVPDSDNDAAPSSTPAAAPATTTTPAS